MADWQNAPIVDPNAPQAAPASAAQGGAAPAWASAPLANAADTGGTDPLSQPPEARVGGSGVIQSAPDNPADLPASARNTPLVPNPVNAADLVQSAISGGSMGLADKGAAALDALIGTPRTLMGQDKQLPGDFSDRYHQYLDQYHLRESDFANAHPLASTLAYGTGMVGTGALLPGIRAGASLARTIAQGIGTGAGVGAAAGLGAAPDTSVGGDVASTATGAGIGALAGGALSAVGETFIKPVTNWIARQFGGEAATNDQGFQQILHRISQSGKAGGPNAQDMLDLINHGQSLGKPLNIADVGGEPVQALAGAIARAPGEGRQIAQGAYAERNAGINQRINADISGNVSGGPSAFDAVDALQKSRAAASGPLYAQARAANPSMSSPEIDAVLATPAGKSAMRVAATKMQNAMDEMGSGAQFPSEAELPAAKAPSSGPQQPKGDSLLPFLAHSGGVQDEGGELSAGDLQMWHVGKPYMPRLVNPQGRQLDYAREAAIEAGYLPEGASTSDLVDAMRSEAAGNRVYPYGNAPQKEFDAGAFQDLNERDQMAAAERNKSLSDLDWLNTNLGPGSEASPTTAPTPGFSLRTLDYVKRALGDQIGAAQKSGARDDVRILTGLKNKLVGAMDSADSTGTYAQARAAYSGPSASEDAVELGQTFNKRMAGENAALVKNMPPGDREFYKLGAADTLRSTGIYSQLGKAETGNSSLQKAALQQKLRPAFNSDAEFNRFIQSSEMENQMGANQAKIIGGSQTAPRVAEDAARNGEGAGGPVASLATGALGLASGEPVVSGMALLRGGGQLLGKLRQPSPAVDAATARMLFRPETAAQTLSRVLANPAPGGRAPLLTAPGAALAGQQLSPLAAALVQAHLGGQ